MWLVVAALLLCPVLPSPLATYKRHSQPTARDTLTPAKNLPQEEQVTVISQPVIEKLNIRKLMMTLRTWTHTPALDTV